MKAVLAGILAGALSLGAANAASISFSNATIGGDGYVTSFLTSAGMLDLYATAVELDVVSGDVVFTETNNLDAGLGGLFIDSGPGDNHQIDGFDPREGVLFEVRKGGQQAVVNLSEITFTFVGKEATGFFQFDTDSFGVLSVANDDSTTIEVIGDIDIDTLGSFLDLAVGSADVAVMASRFIIGAPFETDDFKLKQIEVTANADAVVPVPGALPLFAAGLAAFGLRKKRLAE